MTKSWEKQNLLTRSELDDKEREGTIEDIVAGYRKLWYSEEKIGKIRADLLFDLQKEPFEAEKDELYWDKDKILEEMREKYVNIEDAEIEWYKWKKITIMLPKVKWFEWEELFGWKICEFFVSDEEITKKKFENSPGVVENSWSKKNVWDLLWDFRKYMKVRGVQIDADIDDYEDDLRAYATEIFKCEAWKYLKDIIEKKAGKKVLEDCWLRDEVHRGNNLRDFFVWKCKKDLCCWAVARDNDCVARLFQRLSKEA